MLHIRWPRAGSPAEYKAKTRAAYLNPRGHRQDHSRRLFGITSTMPPKTQEASSNSNTGQHINGYAMLFNHHNRVVCSWSKLELVSCFWRMRGLAGCKQENIFGLLQREIPVSNREHCLPGKSHCRLERDRLLLRSGLSGLLWQDIGSAIESFMNSSIALPASKFSLCSRGAVLQHSPNEQRDHSRFYDTQNS